ncbi:malonate transporter [Kaistia soli DSM 19436]|uniref:Malonate transporter n=1 Tax=Kaistia soli DSM 19436 TaxID=1122133 RepID=A0A1M5L4N0_9HYPH|nr:AEC family transporter [Kaistia soli]SHG59719.1 malonate transporter [Kaistia soli DSM 19436]
MTAAILLALVPVFFVLGLGYAAGRLSIVENHHVDGFNKLVMSFSLPAALFVATASASRSEMAEQVPLFVILSVVMLVILFLWYALARIALKASKADAALQALTIAFPNLAGVGLPIVGSVVGASGTVPIAVALAAGSILVTPFALVMVELSADKCSPELSAITRVLSSFRRALTKPVVVAPFLGVACSLLEVPIDPVAKAALQLIGQAAAGVALFLTGLVLSAQPFRLDWRILGATAVADIARPLLALAIVALVPVSTETARLVILIAAVPSGFFGILFGISYRQDSAALGSMVAASTIVSIATLAIAIALLFP